MNNFKGMLYSKVLPSLSYPIRRNNEIKNIYYHNIVSDGDGYSFAKTNITNFEMQMKYLKENGYKTYNFSQIPDNFLKKSNSKEIIITFDDGFLSNYVLAYPIMKKYEIRFNIFLTVGYIENNNTGYLTWSMIKEMLDSGLVEIGAHTFTHIDANKIDENNFDFEIINVNHIIKSRVGTDVQDFCFPFGNYNRSIIDKLTSSRVYKRIYTSDYLPHNNYNNCSVIGRAGISNDDDMDMFIDKLKGKYNYLYYYYNFVKKNKKGEKY